MWIIQRFSEVMDQLGIGHFVPSLPESVTLGFFNAKSQFGYCQNVHYSRKSVISESGTSENLCIERCWSFKLRLWFHIDIMIGTLIVWISKDWLKKPNIGEQNRYSKVYCIKLILYCCCCCIKCYVNFLWLSEPFFLASYVMWWGRALKSPQQTLTWMRQNFKLQSSWVFQQRRNFCIFLSDFLKHFYLCK